MNLSFALEEFLKVLKSYILEFKNFTINQIFIKTRIEV